MEPDAPQETAAGPEVSGPEYTAGLKPLSRSWNRIVCHSDQRLTLLGLFKVPSQALPHQRQQVRPADLRLRELLRPAPDLHLL